MSKRRNYTDWSGLTRLIETSLSGHTGFGKQPRVEGRLTASHDGIGHENYFFTVAGQELFLRMPQRYLPLHTPKEAAESLSREAETLRRLERCRFPYPTPKLICTVTDSSGATIGLIESGLGGAPMTKFHHIVESQSRLEIIAKVAAQVHELPISEFDHLAPCADSESHVRTDLAALPQSVFATSAVAAAAREWIETHLTNRPAVVLHGDLLPQNLLYSFAMDGGVSIIDWEYARIGDPAYDLAIVTRGARQPLKESDGFQRLIAAYGDAVGTPIPPSAVRIHELLMIMLWLAEAARDQAKGRAEGHGPDFYEDQLLSVLRRCKALG